MPKRQSMHIWTFPDERAELFDRSGCSVFACTGTPTIGGRLTSTVAEVPARYPGVASRGGEMHSSADELMNAAAGTVIWESTPAGPNLQASWLDWRKFDPRISTCNHSAAYTHEVTPIFWYVNVSGPFHRSCAPQRGTCPRL